MISRMMILGAAMAVFVPAFAAAEIHEVQMLNRLGREAMVFEPDALRIAPGDTVRFLAVNPSHNAESVDGMIPEGAEPFAGKMNEEIEVTLTEEGFYGIRCKPHYAMGMVMVVQVGEGEVPEDFLAGRMSRRTKERFEAQLAKLAEMAGE